MAGSYKAGILRARSWTLEILDLRIFCDGENLFPLVCSWFSPCRIIPIRGLWPGNVATALPDRSLPIE